MRQPTTVLRMDNNHNSNNYLTTTFGKLHGTFWLCLASTCRDH